MISHLDKKSGVCGEEMGDLQADSTCVTPLHISRFWKYAVISVEFSSVLHIVVLV